MSFKPGEYIRLICEGNSLNNGVFVVHHVSPPLVFTIDNKPTYSSSFELKHVIPWKPEIGDYVTIGKEYPGEWCISRVDALGFCTVVQEEKQERFPGSIIIPVLNKVPALTEGLKIKTPFKVGDTIRVKKIRGSRYSNFIDILKTYGSWIVETVADEKVTCQNDNWSKEAKVMFYYDEIELVTTEPKQEIKSIDKIVESKTPFKVGDMVRIKEVTDPSKALNSYGNWTIKAIVDKRVICKNDNWTKTQKTQALTFYNNEIELVTTSNEIVQEESEELIDKDTQFWENHRKLWMERNCPKKKDKLPMPKLDYLTESDRQMHMARCDLQHRIRLCDKNMLLLQKEKEKYLAELKKL